VDTGKTGERADGLGERPFGVADVRTEPDVRTNGPRCHGSSRTRPIDSTAMSDVAVWILHPTAAATASPLERAVVAARAAIAERHRQEFLRAGAGSVRIVAGPPDDTPFGARLRTLVAAEQPAGVVVLGSGAVPLATARDLRAFVDAAGASDRTALANNRYSADIVAVPCAERLLALPDLSSDNALPRWLEESAGYRVSDLRGRWRLAIDVDGPLDLVLLGGAAATPVGSPVGSRLAAVTAVARDRRAELLVAGRTSAATIAFLERAAAARVRALVEERGLRTAPVDAPRPPASVLGMLLDRDGAASLGRNLAALADAAVVDTRVLLAHRLGPDVDAWPSAEDRFASDLLLPEQIADPWLRELSASARDASIPIVLGGHTLVGPGLRLLLGSARWS
jgi:hypothetical protein